MQVGEKYDTEMDRMDSIGDGDRSDEGHDNGQRSEDVHDASHREEKQVQHNKEDDGAGDIGLEELQHLQRDFRIDQIIGQAEGSAKDDQDPAHQDHALAHDLWQLAPLNIPVNDHFDKEYIDSRDGGGLTDCNVAAVDPP